MCHTCLLVARYSNASAIRTAEDSVPPSLQALEAIRPGLGQRVEAIHVETTERRSAGLVRVSGAALLALAVWLSRPRHHRMPP